MIKVENENYLINRFEIEKNFEVSDNQFKNDAYDVILTSSDEEITKQVNDLERKYAIRDAYVIKPEKSEEELNSPQIYKDYVALKAKLYALKEAILENAYTLADEYGEITEEKVR